MLLIGLLCLGCFGLPALAWFSVVSMAPRWAFSEVLLKPSGVVNDARPALAGLQWCLSPRLNGNCTGMQNCTGMPAENLHSTARLQVRISLLPILHYQDVGHPHLNKRWLKHPPEGQICKCELPIVCRSPPQRHCFFCYHVRPPNKYSICKVLSLGLKPCTVIMM